MKAILDNCEYTITTESEAAAYQARGFDILDDNGKVKRYGAGKAVPWADYEKLKAENEKLKGENKRLKASKGE